MTKTKQIKEPKRLQRLSYLSKFNFFTKKSTNTNTTNNRLSTASSNSSLSSEYSTHSFTNKLFSTFSSFPLFKLISICFILHIIINSTVLVDSAPVSNNSLVYKLSQNPNTNQNEVFASTDSKITNVKLLKNRPSATTPSPPADEYDYDQDNQSSDNYNEEPKEQSTLTEDEDYKEEDVEDLNDKMFKTTKASTSTEKPKSPKPTASSIKQKTSTPINVDLDYLADGNEEETGEEDYYQLSNRDMPAAKSQENKTETPAQPSTLVDLTKSSTRSTVSIVIENDDIDLKEEFTLASTTTTESTTTPTTTPSTTTTTTVSTTTISTSTTASPTFKTNIALIQELATAPTDKLSNEKEKDVLVGDEDEDDSGYSMTDDYEEIDSRKEIANKKVEVKTTTLTARVLAKENGRLSLLNNAIEGLATTTPNKPQVEANKTSDNLEDEELDEFDANNEDEDYSEDDEYNDYDEEDETYKDAKENKDTTKKEEEYNEYEDEDKILEDYDESEDGKEQQDKKTTTLQPAVEQLPKDELTQNKITEDYVEEEINEEDSSTNNVADKSSDDFDVDNSKVNSTIKSADVDVVVAETTKILDPVVTVPTTTLSIDPSLVTIQKLPPEFSNDPKNVDLNDPMNGIANINVDSDDETDVDTEDSDYEDVNFKNQNEIG